MTFILFLSALALLTLGGFIGWYLKDGHGADVLHGLQADFDQVKQRAEKAEAALAEAIAKKIK